MSPLSSVRRNRRVEGPLTRSAVVDKALEVVRAEGIEALTMRRLAAELRTAPMSVYRHIADRQQLLVAMLDCVAMGIELPTVKAEPDDEVAAIFTAIHRALRADVWAVHLIVADKLASAHILPAVERIYTALRSAGLSAPDIAAGYALLWQYTVGELIDTADGRADEYRTAMVRGSDRRSFPVLHDVITEANEIQPDERYVGNLRRILGGILRTE